MTSRARSEKTPLFRLFAFLVMPLMATAVRLQVKGSENLPKAGSCVLAPNHYSEIDPVIIGWSVWKLGRAPHFLAKASLFRIPVIGFLLRTTGQIPVERSRSSQSKSALATAERFTESGHCVVVYPEGTLTRDPQLWPMRGKLGAARLALENDVPLIPVAHWGAQAVLPRYAKKINFFPPKKVMIRYGDPIDLSAYRGVPVTHALLEEVTELLLSAITALLEELRAEKAPAERWNPADHQQKETGRFE